MQKELSTSRNSETSFYLLSFVYLLLLYLVFNHNAFYFSLDKEDGFIELTGALGLLVASGILFFTGLQHKKTLGKKDYKFYTFMVVSLAFFWAAGEEISWGQHMTGHGTPEWLAKINGQQETNIHNINKKFFDRTLEQLIVLFTVITAIFHFRGKEEFLGFRLPEFPTNLAFMLLPIYRRFEIINRDVWMVGQVLIWGYIIFALLHKNKKLLGMCALFVITAASVFFLHNAHQAKLFTEGTNIVHEVRETMFAITCIFYSLQLYREAGPHSVRLNPRKGKTSQSDTSVA